MTGSLPLVAAAQSDRERAEAIISILAPGVEDTWGLVIPLPPHSKARPRFSKEGKAYKDSADQEAEEKTAWHLRRHFKRAPLTGNVALGAVFFRPNRQVIDSDNLVKHLCDAGNGLLWVDDSQVTAQLGVIELDAARPRTVLVVAPHRSTMLRGTDYDVRCEACGVVFTPPRQGQRSCSRACADALRAGHR